MYYFYSLKLKKELKQYSTLDLYQNTIILHLFLLTKNRKLGAFHFVVKEQLFSIWKNSHFFFWVLTTCGLPPVQLRGFHEDLTTLPRLETVLPTLSSTTIPLTWLISSHYHSPKVIKVFAFDLPVIWLSCKAGQISSLSFYIRKYH